MQTFDFEVLRREPVSIGDLQSFNIEVTLSDDVLELSVAGNRLRFDAPPERDGYAALLFRGSGYVAVRSIQMGEPHSGRSSRVR